MKEKKLREFEKNVIQIIINGVLIQVLLIIISIIALYLFK